MDRKKPPGRWLWYFTLISALIVVYKLLDNVGQVVSAVGYLLGILTPFVVGLMIALLLHRPTRWLEQRFLKLRGRFWQKTARPLSLGIVYVVMLGVVALIISLVLPRLAVSLSDLAQSLPNYIQSATARLEETMKSWPFLTGDMAQMIDGLYHSLLDGVTELLNTENVLTALRGVLNVTTSVIDVVIGIIVSVYMLAGREHLVEAAKSIGSLFMSSRRVELSVYYGHRTASIFYKYFYGALLDALVVGVVTSIGLAIFGVPHAALLGLMLGLLNMIPYFGALVGGVGVVLITLLTNGIYAAIGVAIYIIVVQQLDANVLQPRVVGESVGLRPIYVLLAITLFGGLFGFWGIFLGVPLMAVIQMFVKDLITRKKRKQQG